MLLIAAAVLTGCANNNVTSEQPNTENQTIESIMARRSVRHYTDVPVGRDTLQKLAECGVNAPNGMNKQEWAIRIVDSKEYLDGVTELMKEGMPMMVNNEDPGFRNAFRNATAVFMIGIPEDYQNDMCSINAGLLCENICLAAQSMGLGTCVMAGPTSFISDNDSAKPYLERLNLPEGYRLCICVGVGHPAESPEAKPRDYSKISFVE